MTVLEYKHLVTCVHVQNKGMYLKYDMAGIHVYPSCSRWQSLTLGLLQVQVHDLAQCPFMVVVPARDYGRCPGRVRSPE